MEKYKKAGEGIGEKARLTVDSHGPIYSKQSVSLGFGLATFSQTKPSPNIIHMHFYM